MKLTRGDKFAYWLYWFCGHFGGMVPYDWVSDWNYYLRCRERGMSPWEAYCYDGNLG